MRDEGILTIYSLQNTAPQGLMPVNQLVEIDRAYYARKTASYNRIYAAMGANHQFDMVVRVFNIEPPETGMYVILEDEKQYQIDVCQEIVGKDCVDLTLIRVEDFYDVAEPIEGGE
jgi:hypothetical protein